MTAAHLTSSNHEPRTNSVLLEKLAAVLPKGSKFGIYHLSTPPYRTDALYSSPPGHLPDKTYLENHFLAVSIDADTTDAPPSTRTSVRASEVPPSSKQTLVLALEVFIFTTAYSTIIFVSKADSTGYLQLLRLPKGTPSPIREVTNAFVTFLVEHRQRKRIQTVVSLFARAQSQYLFPGSVENSGKHVLDDRGLVKWWCRVLNPLLEARDEKSRRKWRGQWDDVQGYLTVPGLDNYETRAFLPRNPANATKWTVGHPLQKISHYTAEHDWVPPRCLIPRYPDDPKSRFRDELDQEAAKWKQGTGSWRSVKSLDQFWEMMAFRQECSSGRLTGFIWLVFDPKKARTEPNESLSAPTAPLDLPMPSYPPSTPPRRRVDVSQNTPQRTPLNPTPTPGSTMTTPSKPKEEMERKKKKKKLTGPIIPRQPHIKTQQRNYLLDRPVSTAYYYWPPQGRGERIVEEADYKRMVELLLHLDFSTLAKASGSTKRWISEVAIDGTWGREIVGICEPPSSETKVANTGDIVVTNLSGLTRRKRSADTEIALGGTRDVAEMALLKSVNVLGAGLVRKKRKGEDQPLASTGGETPSIPGGAHGSTGEPKVNLLGTGLVRKKPKPA